MKKQIGVNTSDKSSIEEQIKQLVIARINAYSDDLNISAGDSGNLTTTPLIDVVAKRFLEPSNLVPISLIKGNSVTESYKKSQKLMSKNVLSMMSSEAGQNERDSAPYLYSNKLNQVLLGDPDAVLY
ncbi:hypothetical protein CO009_00220 [Candidatus Shapirobacteria bacterium CG_4_8_14_3_um_filter_35_11]|uniref:Uncharacterized protein n=1 Tax=Candidatus Shapirobacteria bacterium CG_4_8_14_3_um_filter_35_11 TaxID=1974874 RepID=A0A2M8GKQ7_9BACT|nr:MAG: hypothetical protein CO009_00220 [Candidatus Shapirobacteria bacterium CG_4_8_14_3_um_filter_35_11]